MACREDADQLRDLCGPSLVSGIVSTRRMMTPKRNAPTAEYLSTRTCQPAASLPEAAAQHQGQPMSFFAVDPDDWRLARLELAWRAGLASRPGRR